VAELFAFGGCLHSVYVVVLLSPVTLMTVPDLSSLESVSDRIGETNPHLRRPMVGYPSGDTPFLCQKNRPDSV
jgi:hypothetical protein